MSIAAIERRPSLVDTGQGRRGRVESEDARTIIEPNDLAIELSSRRFAAEAVEHSDGLAEQRSRTTHVARETRTSAVGHDMSDRRE